MTIEEKYKKAISDLKIGKKVSSREVVDLKCLDCMCYQPEEVKKCIDDKCINFFYKNGK